MKITETKQPCTFNTEQAKQKLEGIKKYLVDTYAGKAGYNPYLYWNTHLDNLYKELSKPTPELLITIEALDAKPVPVVDLKKQIPLVEHRTPAQVVADAKKAGKLPESISIDKVPQVNG